MDPRRLLPPPAALALALSLAAAAHASPRLPDLDQARPDSLELSRDAAGGYRLGFESAVDNVGRAPLIVDGRRSGEEMVASQVVGRRVVRGVGRLRYTQSEDHAHWHYLGFDRYELRATSDYRLVAPDRKTGFCLGDRYETRLSVDLPGEPRHPVFRSQCGRGHPELRTLREGISIGHGDVYGPTLEGQYVELSGLATGDYFLVHRVNVDRRLRESDYSNNAASLRIRLSWPGGVPSVRVLRACPDRPLCPVQPPP